MVSTVKNRIMVGASLFFGVMLGGTLGFHWIEGWSLLDALYMTTITVTTVGYGEVNPLSP